MGGTGPPFGHGLSYTRFELSELEVPAEVGADEASFVVRVRVRNAGERPGSETPQLYIRPRVANTVAARRLQGYRRITLAAGETTRVELRVPVERLAIYDPNDRRVVEPGPYEVVVGQSAAGGLAGKLAVTRARAATPTGSSRSSP